MTLRRSRSVPPGLLGASGGRHSALILRLGDGVSDTFSDTSSCVDLVGPGGGGSACACPLLKVVGRSCKIFERPHRADIRPSAVWDTGLHTRSFSASRSSGRSRSAIGTPLPCGLCDVQVLDLMYRDITPEDYDMLLRLDEFLPKKTASTTYVQRLRPVPFGERRYDTCGVCLTPFEDCDDVLAVPCPAEHEFHRSCITKWLLEYKNSCPVDQSELSFDTSDGACG
eukprot:gnl/TRDRNA2_/TRDRNA2_199514_c0_seq1.p1 gnl/TRDRNA2_/TRDRNA2_199514_c0~~gnl/TRDRNA2_/TRDRNA2_199514_c0_seq1.p1  ORF type:complete len:226 (+),score=16.59 gnl/TRDRNA2_/TRDRNA2_199514_c0_seq1:90-767(+)